MAAFWLILSGKLEFTFLLLGAFSVAVVCWISWRVDETESAAISRHFILRLPRYLIWLGKEVLLSSVSVLRRIWSPQRVVRPQVAVTPAADMSMLSQVTYANSITLTPGTLAMAVNDVSIEVHALDARDMASLDAGRMLERVRRLEGR